MDANLRGRGRTLRTLMQIALMSLRRNQHPKSKSAVFPPLESLRRGQCITDPSPQMIASRERETTLRLQARIVYPESQPSQLECSQERRYGQSQSTVAQIWTITAASIRIAGRTLQQLHLAGYRLETLAGRPMPAREERKRLRHHRHRDRRSLLHHLR
jgi:hypothetical protein